MHMDIIRLYNSPWKKKAKFTINLSKMKKIIIITAFFLSDREPIST